MFGVTRAPADFLLIKHKVTPGRAGVKGVPAPLGFACRPPRFSSSTIGEDRARTA
jgi:hypothetical protein